MKLSLLFTTAALSSTAFALSEEQECAKKAPSVMNAIGKFCQKSNIVVPSDYAMIGSFGYTGQGTEINILGPCKPAQWVPQKYCLSQFYSICANGNDRGKGSASYGRNKCQQWQISN